jgi:hypothetical protein
VKPSSQTPQLPPQPSGPHSLPLQSGSQPSGISGLGLGGPGLKIQSQKPLPEITPIPALSIKSSELTSKIKRTDRREIIKIRLKLADLLIF